MEGAAAAPMCLLAPSGSAAGGTTTPRSLECRSHIRGPRGGGGRTAALWRPWLPSPHRAPQEEAKKQKGSACGDGEGRKTAGGALASFRHPVRLCWPRSRSFDYLYAEGEALLEHFPVQATISLYEDSEESGSDPEEEEEEEAVRDQRQKAAGAATPVPQGSGHPDPIRGYSLA